MEEIQPAGLRPAGSRGPSALLDTKTLQRNYINNTLEFWSKTLNQLITVNTVGTIPTYRPYKSSNTSKDVTLNLGSRAAFGGPGSQGPPLAGPGI